MLRIISYLQGIYYLITGIWPLVNIATFMAVTGPKADTWLVKLVGALTFSISLLLFLVGFRKRVNMESLVFIFFAMVSYFLIDIIYVIKGRLDTIYLLDASIQAIFIVLWVLWLRKIHFRFEH